MKPTAAETLKLRPRQLQGPDAAHDMATRWRRPRRIRSERNARYSSTRSGPATADDDQHAAGLGFLHLLELAAPVGPVGRLEQVG